MLFLIPGICAAADTVNIPWEEFKTLYKESIEKKILAERKTDPFVYSIDLTSYKISLTPSGVKGQVMIQGSLISGKKEPIPLFDKNMIIKDVIRIAGGSLLCEQEKGILFYPDKEERFSMELAFYLPVQEDTRSSFAKIKIPTALKNILTLDLSKDLMLLGAPGIKDKTGIYNFSAQSEMTLRFADKGQKAAATQIKELSRHFKQVSTPPLVLDVVSYFTSFDENGNVLSVLVMDLPKEAGPYLKIDAIPGTRIWSLKVNHQNKKIYSTGEKDSKWIIPLSRGKISHVELATIQQGKKLGLHGKLETSLPGMELAARKMNMAIALPDRVQLISFEGPLNSDSKSRVHPPKEFIGTPYYFSRFFYKGQAMRIAIMYKEPVK